MTRRPFLASLFVSVIAWLTGCRAARPQRRIARRQREFGYRTHLRADGSRSPQGYLSNGEFIVYFPTGEDRPRAERLMDWLEESPPQWSDVLDFIEFENFCQSVIQSAPAVPWEIVRLKSETPTHV